MKRYFTSVDYGYKDQTAIVQGYMDSRGHIHVTDSYTTEKPMTLLEALALYTTKSDVSDKPARKALLREAQAIVNAEKTRLYQAADAKAEAARTLVDVQAYADNSPFPHMNSNPWLRKQFSDGMVRKTQNAAAFEIKAAFEAGKKAGAMKPIFDAADAAMDEIRRSC